MEAPEKGQTPIKSPELKRLRAGGDGEPELEPMSGAKVNLSSKFDGAEAETVDELAGQGAYTSTVFAFWLCAASCL